MKKQFTFITLFILFFACSKEIKNTNRVNSTSTDNLYQTVCYTYDVTNYYTQCWHTPGGGEYDETCASSPVSNQYTACYTDIGGGGAPVSTGWGGGGQTSGNPNPPPAPPPPIFKPLYDQNAFYVVLIIGKVLVMPTMLNLIIYLLC